LLIGIPSKCKSTTIPLDSIKSCLVLFLKEKHPGQLLDYTTDDLPNFLIFDRRKQEAIENGKDGIFVFSSTLSSGYRVHYLLVEPDSFQILNMIEPIDTNVLKLVQFFERNKEYCRDDILFYIQDLILTYQENEKYIKSFNGIIR